MMKQPADIVLGQSNPTTVTTNSGGVDPSRMNGPCGVGMNSTRLVVADTANNRVLCLEYLAVEHWCRCRLRFGPADRNRIGSRWSEPVRDKFRKSLWPWLAPRTCIPRGRFRSEPNLGLRSAPTKSSGAAHRCPGTDGLCEWRRAGSASHNSSLAGPLGVSSDGDNVAVADTDNHRVLLFRGIAGRNAQPADVVIGQPKRNDFVANNPSPATGLSSPSGYFSAAKAVCGGHRKPSRAHLE